MALEIDIEECLGCGACESACPQGAVTQGGDFPVIYEVDPLLCNDCQQCLVVCPVDGLVADADWTVCHGRGCPLSSNRYADTECSEGRQVCPTCGSMLWRVEGGDWTCRVCVAAANGSRVASCPKVKRAHRLLAGASSDRVLDGAG
ncbi:MAG: 4Fe-4S dicluster domain-containing protein [Acidimicrobiales bacterium]